MASRRTAAAGSGLLMRSLLGMRSFTRFLARKGNGRVGPVTAVRAPKVPKTLPKPLAVSAAVRITSTDLRESEAREEWIIARDAAVLALLYGSGLRLSEALGLKRGDARSNAETLVVTGKGRKKRMVPILPQVAKAIHDYVALCPFELKQDGPLFVGARGATLSPRVVQLAMARL